MWGDFDEQLPGMPPKGTHVRILRIRGFNVVAPPPYAQAKAINYPMPNQQQPPYGQAPNQPYGQLYGPPAPNTPCEFELRTLRKKN